MFLLTLELQTTLCIQLFLRVKTTKHQVMGIKPVRVRMASGEIM